MARTLGKPHVRFAPSGVMSVKDLLCAQAHACTPVSFWNARRPTKRGVGLFQCNARRQHTCCPLSPERKFGTFLGAASNKIHHSSWRRKIKLKMAREKARAACRFASSVSQEQIFGRNEQAIDPQPSIVGPVPYPVLPLEDDRFGRFHLLVRGALQGRACQGQCGWHFPPSPLP